MTTSRLTPSSFDYAPSDVERRPSDDIGRSADEYMDANPSRGETAEDVARWERAKRDFIAKWVPHTRLTVKQAS
jgi:hypothetical protein